MKILYTNLILDKDAQSLALVKSLWRRIKTTNEEYEMNRRVIREIMERDSKRLRRSTILRGQFRALRAGKGKKTIDAGDLPSMAELSKLDKSTKKSALQSTADQDSRLLIKE